MAEQDGKAPRGPTTYVVLEEMTLNLPGPAKVGGGMAGSPNEPVDAFLERSRVEAKTRREAVSKFLNGTDAGKRTFKAVPLSSWKSVRRKPPRKVAAGFEEIDA